MTLPNYTIGEMAYEQIPTFCGKHGSTAVIIGEVIIGKRSVTVGIISAVAGSVIYRIIIALATTYTLLPAYMLKFISAVIVAAALTVPAFKQTMSVNKLKRGGV